MTYTIPHPAVARERKSPDAQIEALDHQLISLREELSREAHRQTVLEYRKLVPVFVELQRCYEEIRGCFDCPRTVTDLEQARLQEVYEVLRLLERELYRVAYPEASMVSSASLSQLLDLCEQEMEKLYFILKQRSQIQEYTEGWWRVVNAARDANKAETDALLFLTNRVIEDVNQAEKLLEILPVSQHLAIQWTDHSLHEQYPFINGVMVARLMAYLIPRFPHGSHYVEQLTAAALLHDTGLLSLLYGYQKNAKDLAVNNPIAFKKHPSYSAVVAGVFKRMPATFSMVISQHHERLNGTGYPDRLIDRSLSPLSRMMAIVCRVVDLMTGTLFAHTPPNNPKTQAHTLLDTFRKLQLEVDLGELDKQLVKQVIRLLQAEGGLDLTAESDVFEKPELPLDSGYRQDSAHERPPSLAPSLNQPAISSWSWREHSSNV
ncbi:MAG: HD domain-containing protein [Planctomycetaceae bacterium]|nr:HD domain-containing protein [Planctomycetaceae bacterium]